MNCVSWPNESRPPYAQILFSCLQVLHESSLFHDLPALSKHYLPGAYGFLHPKHVPAAPPSEQCAMAGLSVPRHQVRFHSAASNGRERSGIGAMNTNPYIEANTAEMGVLR